MKTKTRKEKKLQITMRKSSTSVCFAAFPLVASNLTTSRPKNCKGRSMAMDEKTHTHTQK
jgi:hypothetical protein